MPPQVADQLMLASLSNRLEHLTDVERQAVQLSFQLLMEYPHYGKVTKKYKVATVLGVADVYEIWVQSAKFTFALIGRHPAIILDVWLRGGFLRFQEPIVRSL